MVEASSVRDARCVVVAARSSRALAAPTAATMSAMPTVDATDAGPLGPSELPAGMQNEEDAADGGSGDDGAMREDEGRCAGGKSPPDRAGAGNEEVGGRGRASEGEVGPGAGAALGVPASLLPGEERRRACRTSEMLANVGRSWGSVRRHCRARDLYTGWAPAGKRGKRELGTKKPPLDT